MTELRVWTSGFRGLFRFLRFEESLRDSNQDMPLANVVSEADNVVRPHDHP